MVPQVQNAWAPPMDASAPFLAPSHTAPAASTLSFTTIGTSGSVHNVNGSQYHNCCHVYNNNYYVTPEPTSTPSIRMFIPPFLIIPFPCAVLSGSLLEPSSGPPPDCDSAVVGDQGDAVHEQQHPKVCV